MQAGAGGFPGGVWPSHMTIDAKTHILETSPITISNGTSDALTRALLYSPTRFIVVPRLYVKSDLAISNHANGTVKIGTAADDDAFVASTALQNILASVITALTIASTLKPGARVQEAQGFAVLPPNTPMIVTATAMGAGGTGRIVVGGEYFYMDLNGN